MNRNGKGVTAKKVRVKILKRINSEDHKKGHKKGRWRHRPDCSYFLATIFPGQNGMFCNHCHDAQSIYTYHLRGCCRALQTH